MDLVESLAHKPAQAYLIVGATASQFARQFAQHLFCPQECQHCPHCTKLAHGTHPDLTWVSKSGKRISIDQVRDLQQKAVYPPVEAPKKIYVIESVEDLSLEAANSLLKILEDPPRYLVFILLAKSMNILPTILSRCQIVKLPTPPRAHIERVLRERGLSEREIEILLTLTKGLMPDESLLAVAKQFISERPKIQKQLGALHDQTLWQSLTEQNPFVRREAVIEILKRLPNYSSAQVLDLATTLSKCAQEIIEFFIQEALYWYRDNLGRRELLPDRHTIYALETALWKLQHNANVLLLAESLLFTLREGLRATSA
ncbi:MAG: hypothetical protein NZ930_05605 [Candidatus Bipolaricaulota bacterium]|nr:hypothetical protein [Candidatus Bipolaricaulota bacterium]MDW8031717.1 hypothetical protein [Candidatus Bipolaricaulota bacterium]